MMMLSGANFLIFDEPTNHLDVESIEALEDAIDEYDGTVLLVSHDRALLRALTTRIWVLHDGRITDFAGGFAEWETASAEREHAAAVAAAEEEQLRRVRERKATRAAGTTNASRSNRCGAPPSGRSPRRSAGQRAGAAGGRAARAAGGSRAVPRRRRRGRARARLGVELDEARAALDAAFAEWEAATRALEAIG